MPDIKLITENLAGELIPAIGRAAGVYIMTSFVMESGVKILAPHLEAAIARGAEVKLLAGDYLHITQPNALRRLLKIEGLELRIWRSRGTSFHPKAYLLDYDNSEGLFIVGSSNMSSSAFKMGFEWNLAMNAQAEPYTFQEAMEKFMSSFYHENTQPVNAETVLLYEQEYDAYHHKYPELTSLISKMEEAELSPSSDEPTDDTDKENELDEQLTLTPRPAQAMALDKLNQTLEEGYERAMAVMPTGLGKTYLAAFFAQQFKRILFIAHREELLHQARRSFLHVMPERTSGLYDGKFKEADAEMVFASIYTLSRKRHREVFREQQFDLIVVDEFHHAAADTYRAVLDEIQARFLLGITATPDRMDGKDIYALCDGNVAFEMHFIEAIERGWLSPFHYYGVYDEVDYNQVSWLGTRYDEQELLAQQMQEHVAANIYQAWQKHKLTRTLAFCSSIAQANYLAEYFRKQGHEVISLHSQTREMSRQEAIKRLEQRELEIIFTVDVFNEGVDIPSVDTLLFARPTESLTVFTQQVGRGLRLHDGKQVCHIIDLIGNYRKADLKLSLFQLHREDEGKKREELLPTAPAGCVIDFDLKVIDLLKEIMRKRQSHQEQIIAAYHELKQELGRRPTYLEMHLQAGVSLGFNRKGSFGSYVGMLHAAGELAEAEEQCYLRYQAWLEEVEKTTMQKSYKMIVMLAMLERGPEAWHQPMTPQDAAPFFHHYLMEKEYRKRIDFSDQKSKRLWEYDSNKTASLIAEMPMTKWAGSSKGLTAFDGERFTITIEIDDNHQALLHRWTEEIVRYRLHTYFERKES